jgi:hypothetical protein
MSDRELRRLRRRLAELNPRPDPDLVGRWLAARERATPLPASRLRLLEHVGLAAASEHLRARGTLPTPRLPPQALKSQVELLTLWGRTPRLVGAVAVVQAAWERLGRPREQTIGPLLELATACARQVDVVGDPRGEACADVARAAAEEARELPLEPVAERRILWAAVRVGWATLYVGRDSVRHAGRATSLAAASLRGRGKLLYLTRRLREAVSSREATTAPERLVPEDLARVRLLVLSHPLTSARRRPHRVPGYACPHAVRGRSSISVHLWYGPRRVRAVGRRVRTCCLADPSTHARTRWWGELRRRVSALEQRGLHPDTVHQLYQRTTEAVAPPNHGEQAAHEDALLAWRAA